ncbi:hypothetical protein KCP78_02445 [Salmonella enterica subsp. enterica]|nr:hypothetical protein KCP78_02445 [Salmonella enterica subsp. enterica]
MAGDSEEVRAVTAAAGGFGGLLSSIPEAGMALTRAGKPAGASRRRSSWR